MSLPGKTICIVHIHVSKVDRRAQKMVLFLGLYQMRAVGILSFRGSGYTNIISIILFRELYSSGGCM